MADSSAQHTMFLNITHGDETHKFEYSWRPSEWENSGCPSWDVLRSHAINCFKTASAKLPEADWVLTYKDFKDVLVTVRHDDDIRTLFRYFARHQEGNVVHADLMVATSDVVQEEEENGPAVGATGAVESWHKV